MAAIRVEHQDSLPLQLKSGVILNRQNAGLIQCLHAGRSKAFGNGIIGKPGESNRTCKLRGQIETFIVKTGVLFTLPFPHNTFKERSTHMISDKITVIFGENMLSACFGIRHIYLFVFSQIYEFCGQIMP